MTRYHGVVLPDGYVWGSRINEILRKDEVYLAGVDKFCMIPNDLEGRVVVLFALPIAKIDLAEAQAIVRTNVEKDKEVERILYAGRWLSYAGVLERAERRLVYHVIRSGKWYEAGAVKTDRERFVAACVADFKANEDTAGALYDLCEALSPRLHRYAEHACNRELSEGEQANINRLEARIYEAAGRVGAQVEFNGDPRGCPIKFTFPSGLRNCIDGTWAM